jgi:hypothetical protein
MRRLYTSFFPGRRMPKDELEKMKAQIAQTLRDISFTKKP